MKALATTLSLAALISAPVSNLHANIITTTDGTVTAIYGTGNSDTWDKVVTYTGMDGNFQLALNTHVNPNTGTHNIDFSVNINPAGLPGLTLATAPYTYLLYANNSATPGVLAMIPDNQYGTSATANGQGLKAIFPLGSIGNTIFQNSEPIPYLNSYFGPGATAYTLEVVGPTGSVLATDTLDLRGGAPRARNLHGRRKRHAVAPIRHRDVSLGQKETHCLSQQRHISIQQRGS